MKQNNGREFSKIVLAAAMITYELVTLFGIYCVTNDGSLLPELFLFVGAPTSVAIGFYAWKAKAENLLKIAKLQDEKDPEKDKRNEFIQMLIDKLKDEMEEGNGDK